MKIWQYTFNFMRRWASFLLFLLLVQTGGVTPLRAQAPVLPAGGVVNGASFIAASQSNGAVAPGTIVAVFGQNLSSDLAVALSVPLSTTLNGTSVTFNGTPLPLFFVSANQLNAQIPFNTPTGTVAAVVTRTGQASQSQSVQVATFSPGIFSINSQGTLQGAIQISNTVIFAAPTGSIPGVQTRPATRGVDFLTIYCTGLGPVTNPPAAGSAGAGQLTLSTPTVTIGGVPAQVTFSGLAPGFVGLYQVNVQVPASAPTGNTVALVITIGGVSSNSVTIAVQ